EFLLGQTQRAATRVGREVARHERTEAPATGQEMLDVVVGLQQPCEALVGRIVLVGIAGTGVAAARLAQRQKSRKGVAAVAIHRGVDEVRAAPDQVGVLAGGSEVQLVLRDRRNVETPLYD